ncbi:pyruvate, phosphate dikinase [Rhodobacteraceae bacterium NNCM2]|nr:pyruvate, phosphate dikinase [Coraliihabitans acroporae]
MKQQLGWIGCGEAALDEGVFGTKAALLSRAALAGAPVPRAFVLPAAMVSTPEFEDTLREAVDRLVRAEQGPDYQDAVPLLLSVRASSPGSGSDVVPAILNIGASAEALPDLARHYGDWVAHDLHRRFVQSFGIGGLGVEEEEFEYALYDLLRDVGAESESELTAQQLADLAALSIRLIDETTGEAFPGCRFAQLLRSLRAVSEGWQSPRTRLRRLSRGFDEDAPLALMVQVMAIGLGDGGKSGAGIAHPRDPSTGEVRLTGRYLANAQGGEALMGLRTPSVLRTEERVENQLREPSLEEKQPEAVARLLEVSRLIEHDLGDAYSLDFTLTDGALNILELRPVKRTARGAVQIAVDLAEMGAISRAEALMRIGPGVIDEHLHPTIDPKAKRDQIGRGLPASPGAASGPLVFSPRAAEDAAEVGLPALLALVETSPEDIRGMHAATGVLTVRGGMTSHAAVVARGLGTPCVVGAKDLTLNVDERTLTTADGRVFREGDVITVDGGEGQVLAGAVPTRLPEVTGAFATLMTWADDERRLDVRANADTGRDAETSLGFAANGIGLCRTEHMFFQDHRISAMRQMILADGEADRRAALEKLLPMQRADFLDLFKRMHGLPIVIRLLDPPLHEFLPHGPVEMEEMAAELDLPVGKIRSRALELSEFNPMLGNRGCRIGIAYPEIYEMQVRAIFEAMCELAEETGQEANPEIMVPLVSAVRELGLLKERISATAEAVAAECGCPINYTIGVMIETPRACLRAGDIAGVADFLSFGTNDLTQMLYGLSRDDAGRFIPNYVEQGVFAHDPFHQIDEEGVGEVIRIAIERARAVKPDISIGVCGEHGGDPDSIDFCHRAGFDYVSCSPYRVPIARLAAAQAAIRARR